MIVLYGIKNCDTVKKARHWLDNRSIDYQFHDFRVDGLSSTLLEALIAQSDWESLLNRRSTSWRELTDAQKLNVDKTSAVQLMLDKPTLIKRPVLDTGTKILIGFTPEYYQTEL